MTENLDLNQQLLQIINSLGVLSPEVFLAGIFLFLIIADLVFAHKRKIAPSTSPQFSIFNILCIGALIINIYQISNQYYHNNDTFLFDKMLFLDAKAIFFKSLISIAGIFMFAHIEVNKRKYAGEFYAIVIALVIALQLMTMSVNLLMIYLSIEMVSLLSYILTAFNKDKAGAEGGIKYLIFGATSSAIMLYGMSLLYGMTGTLNITSPDFSRGITQIDELAATVAVVMTISGFLFKLSATPFHIWTPDAYQAASTPVVAFFSIAPKVAAILVAMRFYLAVPNDLRLVTAVIALATITFGNFSALWQNQAKRLLAYSTIAHAGFMLIGLVVLSEMGLKSVVFYLVTYLFANYAAFFLLDIIALNLNISNDIDLQYLKGLGRQKPFLGILMVIIMISLAGLPPTAGFFAKFNIFSAIWEAYQQAESHQSILLGLFLFGLLNTAVSLFFYLKIPFYLFFKTSQTQQNITISLEQYLLAIVFTAPLLILFFKADWLMHLINYL